MDLEMDDEIKMKWSSKYGSITTVTFVVYGEIKEHEVDMMSMILVEESGIDEWAVLAEKIPWQKAKMFDIERGMCLQWVFPDKLKKPKNIEKLLSKVMTFLKLKYESKGVKNYVYTRTT